jgi:hypothetical protein
MAAVAVAAVFGLGLAHWQRPVRVEAAEGGKYRVMKPIVSGGLTLFPVVRADGKDTAADQFVTLDEGFKTGEVEITEAGKARGLVRSRGAAVPAYQGDQVNTLVLVNNSRRPLLLLAGEIVTGGKQDRIIAKDRIVPAGADPIDLSVFCIEHGRWTESSAKFGAAVTSKGAAGSFMVQPAVRQQAMVAKDQQQVWNSVNGAIVSLGAAAAPMAAPSLRRGDAVAVARPMTSPPTPLATTSYAKAMQSEAVSAVVDKEAAGVVASREQALGALRAEHAVGVVVAVRGEVIWADVFSGTGLLARYWTKLVRSYAAEGVGATGDHGTATMADAQRFLDTPAKGREQSDGEAGVYRFSEVSSGGTDMFALEALLPGTGFDVHESWVKLKGPDIRRGALPSPVY